MPIRSGPDHPQWKGGKSVNSNGYVLMRLPAGHHLRGQNGSGYEHRVVAEQKYGRRLLPTEKVHHIDGNRQNNSPDNLVVCKSDAHHKVHHRKVGLNRKLPDEDNPLITCACGCNTQFRKFDEYSRPRKYKSGCNSRGETNPAAKITLELARKIKNEVGTPSQVARKFGVPVSIVSNMRAKTRRSWRNI